MKWVAFIIFLLYTTCDLYSQINRNDSRKPRLDTSVFGKWPGFWGGSQISDDGQHIMYSINKLVSDKVALTIQSTSNSWNEIFDSVYDGTFARKGKLAIFKEVNGSLCLFDLSLKTKSYIEHVSSYQLQKGGQRKYLAYILKDFKNILVVRNLMDGTEHKYDSVIRYRFSETGDVLITESEEKSSSNLHLLHWIDLDHSDDKVFWKGTKVRNFTFDYLGHQLVFSGMNNNSSKENFVTIWYYHGGMKEAAPILAGDTIYLGANFVLDDELLSFSGDGNVLFFSIKAKKNGKMDLASPMVNLWSYSDAKLQSQQLREIRPRNYLCVFDIKTHFYFRLEHDNEKVLSNFENGNYALISYCEGDERESYWNEKSKPIISLISLQTGSGIKLNKDCSDFELCSFSRAGKYVIYYKPKENQYFVYNIKKDTAYNISSRVPIKLNDMQYDRPGVSMPVGIAAWLENDEAVLIYDNYDIWKLDPEGIKVPVNLTEGYGRRNNIQFLLINTDDTLSLTNRSMLILTAFNNKTKENGFYGLTLSDTAKTEKLFMGPYLFYWPKSGFGEPPLKAKDANAWVIKRSSASETPNLFITKDFKKFTPLSSLYPERKFNWLTSKLITWKTFDGSLSQGILYKPENFDPQKKYPMIIYMYELLSQELNMYMMPEASNGTMNIPYFVSNGYLVFTPDIHYKIEYPGNSAYNAVVSATKYLSKFRWVDSTRIGLQGHSWGAYEVNYIITRTNKFAAAASSAGPTDFVSDYGGLFRSISKQFSLEVDQGRLGSPLWVKPHIYIRNSPVFGIDKINTPLLIMHNRNDEQVPWSQGLELFTGLRRLQRKVWMLEYDGEGHSIENENNRMDFSIRLSQFFDHYLKSFPRARWMIDGIPANVKGQEFRYDLEKNND